MAIEELLKQGINKASEIDYGNPVYFIDTSFAPKNPADFYRYVRRTIDSIIKDVKSEVVVNNEFQVEVTGEFSEKYFRTVRRLGIKSANQAEAYLELLFNTRIPNEEPNKEEYKRPSHFKTISNTLVGALIGYSLSPKHPVPGTIWGGLIGNYYNVIVDTFESILTGIKNGLKNTYRSYGLKRESNKRLPLAKKAHDYDRFGRTIREGYVRL